MGTSKTPLPDRCPICAVHLPAIKPITVAHGEVYCVFCGWTVPASRYAAAPRAKRSPVKDWLCLECGRRMTLAAAERASSEGCPKCGGVDIDLATGTGADNA